ncbi:hypothetical protein JTB14_021486 [Gonioctena quinquepunctata]|nr:hypothetical protein JTB14_021486 [Gonioctena quinquepunctata]
MGDLEQPVKPLAEKIGFIGGGNMAKAICEGIVNKGLIKYNQVFVSGPRLNNLASWKEKGAHTFAENGRVVEESDIIFLSVKPHILPTAMANMFDTFSDKPLNSKLFVSILAGTPIEKLENVLSKLHGSRVIRVMPNTPMMVGEGCTVFSPGQRATDTDIEIVKTLLSVTGVCKEVPESLINAVGALAGSGPAYIYLVIEALADGGVEMGIPRAMAIEFAAQTVLGAAKMVKETGRHTGQLKDEVCSPGGTTITGIHALESGGVRAAFMDAIQRSTRKAQEMSEKKH